MDPQSTQNGDKGNRAANRAEDTRALASMRPGNRRRPISGQYINPPQPMLEGPNLGGYTQLNQPQPRSLLPPVEYYPHLPASVAPYLTEAQWKWALLGCKKKWDQQSNNTFYQCPVCQAVLESRINQYQQQQRQQQQQQHQQQPGRNNIGASSSGSGGAGGGGDGGGGDGGGGAMIFNNAEVASMMPIEALIKHWHYGLLPIGGGKAGGDGSAEMAATTAILELVLERCPQLVPLQNGP